MLQPKRMSRLKLNNVNKLKDGGRSSYEMGRFRKPPFYLAKKKKKKKTTLLNVW